MKKILLEIIGLSYSSNPTGAYALVLGEKDGKRRLPIIIGGFEAQSIAVQLENMTPKRPLTHDLFKSFAESFDIHLKEVVVYNLVEGIFHAKLVCYNGSMSEEIDARTSDAIAIAVRFDCPIFTYDFILESAGISVDDAEKTEEQEIETEEEPSEFEMKEVPINPDSELNKLSGEELKSTLKKAIEEEAYEMAGKIRDEINKRRKSKKK
jgi:uncharacterized protein